MQTTPAAPQPKRGALPRFIGAFAGVRVNHPGVGLCRKAILPNCTLLPLLDPAKIATGADYFAAPATIPNRFSQTKRDYHGTIFFNPFFFLLLDSFLLSFLPDTLPVWSSAAGAESALVPPSLVWPSVAAAPSVFTAPSLVRSPAPTPPNPAVAPEASRRLPRKPALRSLRCRWSPQRMSQVVLSPRCLSLTRQSAVDSRR